MDKNKNFFVTIEETLELYLGKKAPSLPTNWKEILVKVAPYLVLIGVILAIPALLAILGIGAFLTPFGAAAALATGKPFWGFGLILSTIFLIINLVFEALAIPGLFKRAKSGWRFMYYGALASIVYNLLTLSLGALIIGGLLSMYLLFQVKEYYK